MFALALGVVCAVVLTPRCPEGSAPVFGPMRLDDRDRTIPKVVGLLSSRFASHRLSVDLQTTYSVESELSHADRLAPMPRIRSGSPLV